MKVVHLTTVHPPFDTRIFHKEAKTLAKAGYNVTLIAQHKKNKEEIEGVRIIGLPTPRNRLFRIFGLSLRTLLLALRQKSNIYHFHDPELIPVGLLLKMLTSARVIYDIHEDYPRQILSKEWIPMSLRPLVARSVAMLEFLAARFFDGLVAATPEIAARFPKRKTVVVQNFPLLEEFLSFFDKKIPYHNRSPWIVYVGSLTIERGIMEIIQSISQVQKPTMLILAGRFDSPKLRNRIQSLPGWQRTKFLGWLNRSQIKDLLGKARVGLVLLHPLPRYQVAWPVKLFEYMAAGIPVIASNFPLWREIIETNQCGICVDPLNPKEITRAIEYLLTYPEKACQMGENGQRAVQKKYNWSKEAEKLLLFYEKLLQP